VLELDDADGAARGGVIIIFINLVFFILQFKVLLRSLSSEP
jgi:hypothetical protein